MRGKLLVGRKVGGCGNVVIVGNCGNVGNVGMTYMGGNCWLGGRWVGVAMW